MRPSSLGGALERSGMVEVVNGMKPDGTEYDHNIRMGVFVVVECETDYQRKCLEEYKVKTDDSGRFMCLYKQWHLIGLELGMSVATVALRGEATGVAREFIGDVVAGQLRPSKISLPEKMLPLGLTGGVKMLRDVKMDTVLTYDDVALDESLRAVQLRRSMEQ